MKSPFQSALPWPAAFVRLAWSNLAAQSAEQVALAAVPLVAVLALGAGVAETGLIAAAQTLPFLLLSLPLGLLADRVARRRLMTAAELMRAVALAAIPIFAVFGLVSVPLLAALGFLAATGTVAYSVAAPSLVPALVPHAVLAAANGRLELVRSLAFAAGPALAGAIVAWAGASPAFMLAAGLSALAALLLWNIEEPVRAAALHRPMLHDLREGAGFTWSHPLLRPILLTAVAWNLSWFVLQAAYVPYAVERLGLTAVAIGITLAAYGAGMVTGAALASRIALVMPFGALVAIGPVVSVAAAGAMLLSLWVPSAGLPTLAFFLFGAGPIVWTIAQTTLRQAVTPARMLGRVSAVMMMATYGARPLGAGIAGFVGLTWGLPCCIGLAFAGFAVQALIVLASPVPRLARLPDAVAT